MTRNCILFVVRQKQGVDDDDDDDRTIFERMDINEGGRSSGQQTRQQQSLRQRRRNEATWCSEQVRRSSGASNEHFLAPSQRTRTLSWLISAYLRLILQIPFWEPQLDWGKKKKREEFGFFVSLHAMEKLELQRPCIAKNNDRVEEELVSNDNNYHDDEGDDEDDDESLHEDGGEIEEKEAVDETATVDLTSVLLSWVGKGEPERRALQELALEVQPRETPMSSSVTATKRSLSTSQCPCSAPARYRCPGCEALSCSLPCVQQHKLASGCTGRRDVTAFVPLSAMTEGTLRSDLAFIAGLQRDAAARRRAPQTSRSTRGGRGSKGLVRAAAKRGVHLRLLPQGMLRRRRNASHWSTAQAQLVWQLEWRLPDGSRLVSHAPDTARLAELWQALPLPEGAPASPSLALLREPRPHPPLEPLKLLDSSLPLAAALKDETLLEHPIIVVQGRTPITADASAPV